MGLTMPTGVFERPLVEHEGLIRSGLFQFSSPRQQVHSSIRLCDYQPVQETLIVEHSLHVDGLIELEKELPFVFKRKNGIFVPLRM